MIKSLTIVAVKSDNNLSDCTGCMFKQPYGCELLAFNDKEAMYKLEQLPDCASGYIYKIKE